MIKMSRLATSLLGAAVVVLPLAATAQQAPAAIATSIGATFTTGQVAYDGDNLPSAMAGIQTLAVSVATGAHAAVASSTATFGPVMGSTANAGASNTAETDLDSYVTLDERGFAYESEVNVSSEAVEYACYPAGPLLCGV